jgi:DNA binding domain, excisionase family
MTLEQRIIELEERVRILEKNVHDEYYTVKELAKHFQCSSNTIYVKIRKGEIKAARNIGATIRIPMSQFENVNRKLYIRDKETVSDIDLMKRFIWDE